MIDLKQITVETFADSIKRVQEQEKLPGHKLICITAFGLIEGTYKYVDTSREGQRPADEYDLANILMASREIKIDDAIKTEGEEIFIQKSKPIVLEEVRIHSSGNKIFHLPLLTLFSDQIIGVTLGELGDSYAQN